MKIFGTIPMMNSRGHANLCKTCLGTGEKDPFESDDPIGTPCPSCSEECDGSGLTWDFGTGVNKCMGCPACQKGKDDAKLTRACLCAYCCKCGERRDTHKTYMPCESCTDKKEPKSGGKMEPCQCPAECDTCSDDCSVSCSKPDSKSECDCLEGECEDCQSKLDKK